MWKASLLIFLILSGVISGMLLWQWQAYSKQADVKEGSEVISQELSVETRQNELIITQRIFGLIPQKEYKLVIPETLFRWKCKSGTGEACDSADENPYTFYSTDNQMVFEYVVPINQNSKAILLTDWFVKIPGIKAGGLSITISDSYKRAGTWAAGVQLKAQKKLDLIDYYYYEGNGNVPSLYWQHKAMSKKTINNADVYSDGKQTASLSFQKLNDIGKSPFITIVLTDQYPEFSSGDIVITAADTKVETLEKKLIALMFEKKFGEVPDRWVVDLLAAQLLKVKPGTEKGNSALAELQGELTEDELEIFFTKATQEDFLETEKLDEILSDAKGLRTSFFTMNKKSEDPLIPLYFYEEKKLLFSGVEQKSIDLILRDGKRLLPFIAAMEALGFEVKVLSDEETMLVSKGNDSYRFYPNKNVFIYNEEDYGLLKNPLTTLNGTVFTEVQWLKSLFGVTASEDNGEINLTPKLD